MRNNLFCIALVTGIFGGFIAALLIGLGIGLFEPTYVGKDNLESQVAPVSSMDVRGVVDLNDIVTVDSPLLRNVQFRRDLIRQDVSFLLTLLDQSQEINQFQVKAEVQDVLIETIASIDPPKALEKVWEFEYNRWSRLVKLVFREWASQDFCQAVQAAVFLRGTPRKTALTAIVETEADKSELQQIAESLGIVREVDLVSAELRVMALLNDPVKAFDLVFSDSIRDAKQEDLFITIADSWFTQGGIEIFPQFLNMIKERYRESDVSLKVLRKLVETMSVHDPQYMWSLLPTESSELKDLLVKAVLETWSKQDFELALQVVTDSEIDDGRGWLYSWFIDSWSIREPKTVLENIQSVRTEHRRGTISWSIRRVYQRYGADEAINFLYQLEEQGENIALAQEFLCIDWAQEDPSAVANWILSSKNDDENELFRLLGHVLPHLATFDAEQALMLAQHHDKSEYGGSLLSLEAKVVESAAKSIDFEQVKNLLEKVSQSAQGIAYLNVGRVMVSWNAIDEALRLGEELPRDLQTSYFSGTYLQLV
ncbi:MAG: hypothetical protein OXG88_04100 [Gammaproteobacteria bacterium]|nr:hypothetical protein [Gammaproteobacteria bacterium]